MSDHKYACVYCNTDLPRDEFEFICVDCQCDEHTHHPKAEIYGGCGCLDADILADIGCPSCEGTGFWNDNCKPVTCARCNGTGKWRQAA